MYESTDARKSLANVDHILTSLHPYILTSLHPYILTSSNPYILISNREI